MADFIEEYFLNPMRHPESYAPYNLVNTVVYAVAALVAAYLIYKLLKRLGVKIDERFVAAIIPFVLFGSALRVIEDAGILPRAVNFLGVELFPFVTPGIYFLTFGAVVFSLAIALIAERKFNAPVWKVLGGLGCLFAAAALAPVLLSAKYLFQGLLILVLGAAGLFLFEGLSRLLKQQNNWVERAAVFAQCFDGAATFVGIGIGTPTSTYFEQHVVGGTLIGAMGPIAFYALKVAFALAAVMLVKKELEKPVDFEKKNYVLLLLTIFGLAPGARDALRIMAGV
ncbi:DUF63 family protein [Candidatus Micrarchaeota archaeon]|nr:DUF63 family protein [Candidatus Micrarchaeota archaeon]